MNNPLTDALTPLLRKRLYLTYGLVVLVVGGVQVGLASSNHSNPGWLTATLAVLAYAGAALGFTAGSNVTAPPADPVDAVFDGAQGEKNLSDDAGT